MSEIKFVHVTPEAEKLIAHCARVSSPNQDNPLIANLLAYCIKGKHWSIFEMVSMCVEIFTTRAIAQQILRHRSFSFQEFSQRYSAVSSDAVEIYEARRQDVKNRQNSIDDLPQDTIVWFKLAQENTWETSRKLYEEALERGIAKESARFLLPLNTKTKMYMHGTARSWIHYLMLRCEPGTQKEHRDIALVIQGIFAEQFPISSEALGWKNAN